MKPSKKEMSENKDIRFAVTWREHPC